MKKNATILIVEADDSSYGLIEVNLQRSGIRNKILRFHDSRELFEFLFESKTSNSANRKCSYLLILDCDNSIEVLERMKKDNDLRKIPVVILADSDGSADVSKCHILGCSTYLVKPKDHEEFISAVQKIGLFLSVVEVPEVNCVD